MPFRRIGAVAVVALIPVLLLVPAAAAHQYPHCAPGQAPQFVFGFKALKDAVGEPMGEPIECEHTEAATVDAHQQTTTGLSFYRKATNTPTFTNGFETGPSRPEGSFTGRVRASTHLATPCSMARGRPRRSHCPHRPASPF